MQQVRGCDWAIVLAAGDGTRLSALTTAGSGRTIPKQFCSLRGERSLLREALDRAQRVVPRERIVVIVAAAHEEWWRSELTGIPADHCIVQPENKGTAAGVLLPLLAIVGKDPQARVLLVPSDHHVEREAVLASSLRQALAQASQHPLELCLLGIRPDCEDSEYGWIVPAASGPGPVAVQTFVEKPGVAAAERLRAQGALWNSFLLAAQAQALLALYHDLLPELLHAFLSTDLHSNSALRALYRSIAPRDFSRDLLQGRESALRVLSVPCCGWTDLGTPDRVAACVARLPYVEAAEPTRGHAIWDLSLALEQQGWAGSSVGA